jgi:cytochrome c peroxidase
MAEPESPSYASRSATKFYRTAPHKGLWQHAPYFHDGSAATLEDVVRIYNTKRSLGLTPQQLADLSEYLKSL